MKVKIVLDSINPYTNVRLTTFHLVYPQVIHQQMLSFKELSISSIKPKFSPGCVYPIWTRNNDSYNGLRLNTLFFEEDRDIEKKANKIFDEMRQSAESCCEQLESLGVSYHNIENFLLPFQNIEVILTGTDFFYFFEECTDYKNANPEIFHLSMDMLVALEQNEPERTDYHLPFVEYSEKVSLTEEEAFLVSSARCANINYFYESNTKEEAIKSTERLIENKNFSFFEHQAVAMFSYMDYYDNLDSWQSFRNQKGY